jgi:curli biogenesis system outer membrane secretion channel CsgG
MKALLTSAVLVFFAATLSFGQEKTSVGILPFTYVQNSASIGNVNSIQETVINAFVKTKRFNIVDRSKMDALKNEKELQKTDDFIDGSVVDQGKNLGAAFLISGHVISAQSEQMRSDDGKGNVTISYKAKLAISLKVIDVATGQVITSETIEPKSGSTLGGMFGIGSSSASDAITKSITKIEEKIDEFVSRNFPIYFSIAEIQEKDSKGGASVILLAGGSGFGLKKGDKLKVVELTEMEVNGKKLTRKKEIGELKITNVEDENFSICSVNTGGDIINSKFEGKAKLQVITK